jgi:hypothetical protein
MCASRGDCGPEVRFAVHVGNDNRGGMPPLVRPKALCGRGDQGEPVPDVSWPGWSDDFGRKSLSRPPDR